MEEKNNKKRIPMVVIIVAITVFAAIAMTAYLQNTKHVNSVATEGEAERLQPLGDTEIAELTSEYSFSDYNSIQTENTDVTTYDVAMKYPVIINTGDNSVYLAALDTNDASMAEDDLVTILYKPNGESRKSTDEISNILTEEQNTKYPVVSETKYYRFVQISDMQYCDTFSGVIYETDSATGAIMPVFTTDGTLYTLDQVESGK